MNAVQWLKSGDCPHLQTGFDLADSSSPQTISQLLDVCVSQANSESLPSVLLLQVAAVLHSDQVMVLEATPKWPVLFQHGRRGAGSSPNPVPRTLLSDVLDRSAGTRQPPTANVPAYVAAPLVRQNRTANVLLASRMAIEFSSSDLEYAVAAAHYLGIALDRLDSWRQRMETCERLEALVEIGQQLVEQRETVPLLEHIAEQSAKLLRCERASIFLWDKDRSELVGRPALGLPGGELRIADNAGIVGKVVQTGQIAQVDDVSADPNWNSQVDTASGFQTRSLLCVPLIDAEHQRIGALEVMNKQQGRFSSGDIETLQALGKQTVAAIESVREREAILRSNAEFEDQARQGCRIIGESTQILELKKTLDGLARTNLPVLILGESGTGKDVVARAIHFSSQRHAQPFVPVNCAAIAESLLESELFGHEKGAFTDAHTDRAGKFEAAHGGTLFLDEIGDLSAGGQAKLLRVLEEKVVYRVGGTQPIPVDTRIVAATNRDLAEAVRQKKFREDLFYRLSVVALKLPPLRERQDDVLLLADFFLKQFCRDAGHRTLKFSAEAKKRLVQHPWPGNVRELRNMLERVAYLCPGEKIEPPDLPFISRPTGDAADDFGHLTLSEATNAFQAQHINKSIERARGNMSDAAKLLGLHRPNLYRKMKLLDMQTD